METILITGGAGFIGIHTCLVLLDKGYKLVIIDSLINSSYIAIKRLKSIYHKTNKSSNNLLFYKGDIRDISFLRKVFKDSIKFGYEINYVIHFAGLKSVFDSFFNKKKYWEVNVKGTINLTKVMEENKCFNIIFSSSASVYSEYEISPLNEKAKVKANNPYAENKLEVESILKNLYKSKPDTWSMVSLRYFNPIGAHSSGEIGEEPKGKINNIFPLLCKSAFNDNENLLIYGNDWPTKDGTGVRDYIHVMDLAEGHVSALEYIKKGHIKSPFSIINLGTGKGTSVLELINVFKKVNRIDIKYEFTERRKGDKPIIYADIKKALKVMNWKPKRNIEDMCKDGWKWFINNPYGYKE